MKKTNPHRFSILEYQLSDQFEGVSMQESVNGGEAYLLIKFKYQNRESTRRIRIKFLLDQKDNVSYCYADYDRKVGDNAKLVDAKILPKYEGVSGEKACKEEGFQCEYVISSPYVKESLLPNHSTFSACVGHFNTDLNGVENGLGKGNIHNCQASLGDFETFKGEGYVGKDNIQRVIIKKGEAKPKNYIRVDNDWRPIDSSLEIVQVKDANAKTELMKYDFVCAANFIAVCR